MIVKNIHKYIYVFVMKDVKKKKDKKYVTTYIKSIDEVICCRYNIYLAPVA